MDQITILDLSGSSTVTFNKSQKNNSFAVSVCNAAYTKTLIGSFSYSFSRLTEVDDQNRTLMHEDGETVPCTFPISNSLSEKGRELLMTKKIKELYSLIELI